MSALVGAVVILSRLSVQFNAALTRALLVIHELRFVGGGGCRPFGNPKDCLKDSEMQDHMAALRACCVDEQEPPEDFEVNTEQAVALVVESVGRDPRLAWQDCIISASDEAIIREVIDYWKELAPRPAADNGSSQAASGSPAVLLPPSNSQEMSSRSSAPLASSSFPRSAFLYYFSFFSLPPCVPLAGRSFHRCRAAAVATTPTPTAVANKTLRTQTTRSPCFSSRISSSASCPGQHTLTRRPHG